MSTQLPTRLGALERISGILLIAGFVMLVTGGLVAPVGAYQGTIGERLSIIDANETQWLLSKVLDGLAVALVAVGLVMLARRDWQRGWPVRLGGTCFAIVGVTGVVYVFMLATDPGPFYDRDAPAPIVTLLVALMAAGLIAFGRHLQCSDFPKWAGLLNMVLGAGVLVSLFTILIIRPGPESAFVLVLLVYLGVLAIGVALLRLAGRAINGVG